MRVLVCGGRRYGDFVRVSIALDALRAATVIDVIIEGGATGADTLAHAWAKATGIRIESFPADWDLHGKAAGHIRNRKMLDHGRPDYVVAFPGGPGTADMVRQATREGLPVWRPYGL